VRRKHLAQSFSNYQNQIALGRATSRRGWGWIQGHETVTKLLLEARCNVGLQDENGWTPRRIAAVSGSQWYNGLISLQLAERQGHTARIASLIRNINHNGADRTMKDALLQACLEHINKQQDDADRAMKDLLEEEEKAHKIHKLLTRFTSHFHKLMTVVDDADFARELELLRGNDRQLEPNVNAHRRMIEDTGAGSGGTPSRYRCSSSGS
jgi:hypothetical protein